MTSTVDLPPGVPSTGQDRASRAATQRTEAVDKVRELALTQGGIGAAIGLVVGAGAGTAQAVVLSKLPLQSRATLLVAARSGGIGALALGTLGVAKGALDAGVLSHDGPIRTRGADVNYPAAFGTGVGFLGAATGAALTRGGLPQRIGGGVGGALIGALAGTALGITVTT